MLRVCSECGEVRGLEGTTAVELVNRLRADERAKVEREVCEWLRAMAGAQEPEYLAEAVERGEHRSK
jgi:hypothetical protein